MTSFENILPFNAFDINNRIFFCSMALVILLDIAPMRPFFDRPNRTLVIVVE